MTGRSDNKEAVTPAKSFGCLVMILVSLAMLIIVLALLWGFGWYTVSVDPALNPFTSQPGAQHARDARPRDEPGGWPAAGLGPRQTTAITAAGDRQFTKETS